MKVTGFQDTINWYNQNAVQYAKSIQNIAALKQIDDFITLLPVTNKKVLDAGCAAGRDSKLLSEKGAEITGLDLSPELLRIAKAELPQIPFIEGNFLNLPFENGTFGGVWSHASLLHCETTDDVLAALGEFYRVLVEGGILYVYLKVNTRNKKFDVVKDTLTHHDRFFQYFTNDELKDLLHKSGFKLIKMENEKDPVGRAEVLWVVSLSHK